MSLQHARHRKHKESYNDRLFGKNWRSRLHKARYHWLVRAMREQNPPHAKILELGCYDGKVIEFLEQAGLGFEQYLGLDADWEGGLEIGRTRWKDRPEIALELCRKPEDAPNDGGLWDIGICMETLEHVSPDLVEPYLLKLSQMVQGTLFITGPIERGFTFLFRHVPKLALRIDSYRFTVGDFVNSALGRLERVPRYGHKGFDDRLLIQQVARYFDIVRVDGILPGLPIRSLNFQFGIVAKSRQQ